MSLTTENKVVITTPSMMQKRERIRLERVDGDRNRVESRDALVLWYDSRQADAANTILPRIDHFSYTGIILYPDNVAELLPQLSGRLQKILHIENESELAAVRELPVLQTTSDKRLSQTVIASADRALLAKAKELGFATCLRAHVDDGQTLHASIQSGSRHEYLLVSFRDPTNIPLELVIATLQGTETILIKEITDPQNVEDALVTLGVMEVGADGVAFSPHEHSVLDDFLSRLNTQLAPTVGIQPATVIRSAPVGMGYRSCLDLATLFSPEEGMIVGSTSQGGILCCPEVFFLPYMELRPFRVNAGAVHSYVYNSANRTDYMTELRAGSPVMVVGTNGQTRLACIGRVKTEVRPLRLIEVEFESGERVNVLMQDDWHVRVFGADGKPRNITELKPGDKVLGHLASPGRHVGIKVDEHILEN